MKNPDFFQYAVGRRPKFELYDLLADPHCMDNLAGQSANQQILQDLHNRLINEMRITGDPRLQNPIPFESPPYTGEFKRNKSAKKGKRQ